MRLHKEHHELSWSMQLSMNGCEVEGVLNRDKKIAIFLFLHLVTVLWPGQAQGQSVRLCWRVRKM